ncbi:hypothetical protein BJ508DRAFT_309150 [Ascobolus immersus RN42]|uniref:Uncharacterized protein n=1 Tax=Ascobolus immersus RN42 TaxID=1160509 RepID=A0A3N4HXC7_ASCIM|nr:hypothetical protein BJ508DRAFT_309150 [Ascobolus immersus RN42]
MPGPRRKKVRYTRPIRHDSGEEGHKDLFVISSYDKFDPVFCGARTIDWKYQPLRSRDMMKLHQRNQNPLVPVIGLSYEKAKYEVEPTPPPRDEESPLEEPPEDLETDDASTLQEKANKRAEYQAEVQAREDAYQAKVAALEPKIEIREIGLAFNRRDDDYLISMVKNRTVFAFDWNNTAMAECVVKDALGIDSQHPEWERVLDVTLANHSTNLFKCQEAAFKSALLFWETDAGKAEFRSNWANKPAYYVKDGVEHPRLPVSALFPERLKSFENAVLVFDSCMDGIDLSVLVKSEDAQGNKTLTRQGDLFRKRAFQLVRLQSCLASTMFDAECRIVKTKKGRRPGYILDYLSSIDLEFCRKTMTPTKRLVGRLFKMPDRDSGLSVGGIGRGTLVAENEDKFSDDEGTDNEDEEG